jgi:uracil DNA glycosylase
MTLPEPKEIVKKLREELKDTDWYDKLSGILISREMVDIVDQLLEKKKDGLSFYPAPLNKIWNPFYRCPFENIKVVMLADEVGDEGVPMSKEREPGYVEKQLFPTISPKYKGSPNLDRWLRQGVLILPVAMTRTVGTEGAIHYDIWRPLLMHIVHKLNESYPEVPWILIKAEAIKMKNVIKSPNKVEIRINPTNHNDCWNWCNNILKEQGKTEIKW